MLYNLTLTELQTHIVKRAVETHIDALHTEMYDYNSRDSLDDIRAQIAESHKLLNDLKVSKSNPIDVSEKDIELKVTSNSAKTTNTTVSDWKRVSTGVYELTVTSGTQTENLRNH